MKEEKYINHLFKAAKNEPTKHSFEEVAKRFEISLVPINPPTGIKAFLTNFITLNSLLIVSLGSLIIAVILWSGTPVIESNKEISKINSPIKKKQANSYLNSGNQIITKNLNLKKEVKTLVKPIVQSVQKVVFPIQTKENNKVVFVNNGMTTDSIKETRLATTARAIKIKKQEIKPSTERDNFKKNKKHNTFSSSTANSTSPSNVSSQTIETKTILASRNSLNKKEIIFQLNSTDNEKLANIFIETIRAYGIENHISSNKRKKGEISKITFKFKHTKGFDWKLKLQNFKTLEVKLLLDDNKNAYGISYRLNKKGQFSEYMKLTSKWRSHHKFSGDNSRGSHKLNKSSN